MEPPNEEQKLTEAQPKTKKRGFRIERLEERIAPRDACRAGDHCHGGGGHYNPHGKWVGG